MDEDLEDEEIDSTLADTSTNDTLDLDTSINLKTKGGKTKSAAKAKKRVKIIEEVESDQEMEAN